MRTLRTWALAAASGAALLPTLGVAQRPAETIVAARAPSLIVRGDRLFVPARINGREVEALLDSGAELTIVDRAYAAEIGLATAGAETARGTGGETEATFAENATIEAAGVVLEDRTIAVLDLTDIAARLIGAPLGMIVGRELFDAARLEIDIEQGVIHSIDRGAQPRGIKLAMETHRGLQTIPVAIEGRVPVQADFDLGNGSEVLIGADYAARAGLLEPGRVVAQKPGGGIGGEVLRDIVVLDTLEVAGKTFTDVEAAIDRTPSAADANVGIDILRNFALTIDFAENAVWLDARP
jgi:predicted aspartyl protease